MSKISSNPSDTNGFQLFFSKNEIIFILTILLKVIRLDKGNIKYNYRVYKIIDRIVLTINNI